MKSKGMQRSLRTVLAFTGLSTSVAFFGASACAKKKTTELVVAVQTDVQVPKDLDSVKVKVLSFGAVQFEQDYEVGPGGLKLPATIGIVPGKDDTQPVDIVIIGSFKGKQRVLREARLKFASDRVVLMRMPLRFSCFEKLDCATDQACVAGACQGIDIEVSKLPDFSNDDVFGPSGATNGSGCFDPDVCLASSIALTALADDPCTFDLRPAVDGGTGGPSSGDDAGGPAIDGSPPSSPKSFDPSKPPTLLLRLDPTKPAGFCSGGECKVPLDYDADEGWVFVDDAHTKVRLAGGLCQRLKDKAFLGVGATDACGTKTISTPFCDKPTTSNPDSGVGCGVPAVGSICKTMQGRAAAAAVGPCSGFVSDKVLSDCAAFYDSGVKAGGACLCAIEAYGNCLANHPFLCSDGGGVSPDTASCSDLYPALTSACPGLSFDAGGGDGGSSDATVDAMADSSDPFPVDSGARDSGIAPDGGDGKDSSFPSDATIEAGVDAGFSCLGSIPIPYPVIASYASCSPTLPTLTCGDTSGRVGGQPMIFTGSIAAGTASPCGPGLVLDGSTVSGSIADSPNFTVGNALVVSFWGSMNGAQTPNTVIVGKLNAASGWFVDVDPSGTHIRAGIVGGPSITSKVSYVDGSYHHVLATFEQFKAIKLYVDDRLEGQVPLSVAVPVVSDPVVIAHSPARGGYLRGTASVSAYYGN